MTLLVFFLPAVCKDRKFKLKRYSIRELNHVASSACLTSFVQKTNGGQLSSSSYLVKLMGKGWPSFVQWNKKSMIMKFPQLLTLIQENYDLAWNSKLKHYSKHTKEFKAA